MSRSTKSTTPSPRAAIRIARLLSLLEGGAALVVCSLLLATLVAGLAVLAAAFSSVLQIISVLAAAPPARRGATVAMGVMGLVTAALILLFSYQIDGPLTGFGWFCLVLAVGAAILVLSGLRGG